MIADSSQKYKPLIFTQKTSSFEMEVVLTPESIIITLDDLVNSLLYHKSIPKESVSSPLNHEDIFHSLSMFNFVPDAKRMAMANKEKEDLEYFNYNLADMVTTK
jgi:hypothetical protein